MNIFKDKRLAPLWITVCTLLRVWIGYDWLMAGWEKLTGTGWIGSQAGTAITGFLKGALAKSSGAHAAVSGWYASFVQNVALPNAKAFSYMVAFGEFLVGLGLILGAITTVALIAAAFMNLNYMLAGTTSTNPQMYTIAIILLAAGAYAKIIGLDYYIMPRVRKFFHREVEPNPVK